MKPYHVIRDAPAASSWWIEERLQLIAVADPLKLEEYAKAILPHAWGTLRKVRGGIEGKRSWLSWALVLQRCIAVEGSRGGGWSDETRFTGKEWEDPVQIYRPLVEKFRESNPGASPTQIAQKISAEMPGEDWSDISRAQTIVESVWGTELPILPFGKF